MKICITTGTGVGPTSLAAFDAALLDSGVGNYNLLPLSSVIPPGSVLECTPYIAPKESYGHRLYVVIAEQRAMTPGQEAWAGLGWTQDRTGKGLFVELHDSSKSLVRESIRSTLQWMIANRNDDYGPIYEKVVGIQCIDQPVCAVVIAVYESQGWNDQTSY